MKINFYRKNVYGNELMYIADKNIGSQLSWLLNTKTICEEQMKRLTALFGVEWVETFAPKSA